MKELVFATNNKNKLFEIRELLRDEAFKILSLEEINCREDIPEPYETLEENALAKAKFIKNNFQLDCFADDTGLEISALNGRPGVYSARYAGEAANSSNNMDKVLNELQGIQNRKAQFRTIIALIFKNQILHFEGSVQGNIATEKSGEKGFGYDPIFIPENKTISFAEMSIEEKNQISHRARAVKKLIEFLKNYNT